MIQLDDPLPPSVGVVLPNSSATDMTPVEPLPVVPAAEPPPTAAPPLVAVPALVGTVPGLQMLSDFAPDGLGSYPAGFVAVGNATYFTTYSSTWTTVLQTGLWKTDGTAAGTVLVKSLNGGSVWEMTAVGDTLYFAGMSSDGHNELWKSDGTEAGTVCVKRDWGDFLSGSEGGPHGLTDFNGTLYFRRNDPQRGWQLWKSDGAEAGTVLVKELAGLGFLTVVQGALYYATTSRDAVTLWRSDGTSDGTVIVKEFASSLELPTSLSPLVGRNGTLSFFVRPGLAAPIEMWKSNGTEAGTVFVRQVPDLSWPFFGSPVMSDGVMYFTDQNRVLWRSDGTDVGTYQILDASGGNVFALAAHGGVLYYATSPDNSGDFTLWQTDGTETGAQCLGTIQLDGFYWAVRGHGVHYANGRLYFGGNDGIHGQEPWSLPVAVPVASAPPADWPAPADDSGTEAARIALAMTWAFPDSPADGLSSVDTALPRQGDSKSEPAVPPVDVLPVAGEVERRERSDIAFPRDGDDSNDRDLPATADRIGDSGGLGKLVVDLPRVI